MGILERSLKPKIAKRHLVHPRRVEGEIRAMGTADTNVHGTLARCQAVCKACPPEPLVRAQRYSHACAGKLKTQTC